MLRCISLLVATKAMGEAFEAACASLGSCLRRLQITHVFPWCIAVAAVSSEFAFLLGRSLIVTICASNEIGPTGRRLLPDRPSVLARTGCRGQRRRRVGINRHALMPTGSSERPIFP